MLSTLVDSATQKISQSLQQLKMSSTSTLSLMPSTGMILYSMFSIPPRVRKFRKINLSPLVFFDRSNAALVDLPYSLLCMPTVYFSHFAERNNRSIVVIHSRCQTGAVG